MKNKSILLTTLAVVMAAALGLVACKKNMQEATSDRPLFASGGIIPGACGGTPGSTGRDTLSGVLGTGHLIPDTIRLFASTYHCLQGLVYVDTLDVLEIEAGTQVLGLEGGAGLSGGGLIITRGAKIEAEGSPSCPIVFTTHRVVDGGTPTSGDWAGVILLGRAPVNQPNPQIEGVPSVTPADSHYGGEVCGDNSGILKYVRIEYAGYALSLNNEINGLTFGGVGCGTTIDYVEVYKANDDAFEFFGGTVNCTHMVAVDPLDDIYDFDFGYTGHIQFALGLADQSRADQSTSNGIECDNNNTSGFLGSPETRPVISNMTLIGYETSTLANSALHGVGNQWRRNAGFMLENSIVMGFKTGLLLDGCQSETKYLGSSPVDSLKFNLVHAYNTSAEFLTTGACFSSAAFAAKATTSGSGCGFENNSAFSGVNANAGIGLVNPFDRSGAGFYQPNVGSPALTGFTACGLPGLPNCCSFDFATGGSFRGAFGPDEDDDWAFGWTKF
jgi:hypothetical protein